MKRAILLLLVGLLYPLSSSAQSVGIKTNILYSAVTFTPNIGLEVALSDHITLDLSGGYNPWNLNNEEASKKLVHWLGELEIRYWFCTKFSGLFVGLHALGTQYNIASKNLKWLFGTDSQEFRYEGYGIGGGISVGYDILLSKRWNLEFALGGGYTRLNYDKYDCVNCGRIIDQNSGNNYWGITRAIVAISFLL